jgi:exonuclease SbcC
MILDRLILKDVFAFRGTVDLPVGDIGPGVVAIVGDNGKGKTGVIEVVPAVNYVHLPGHDDDHPASAALTRDARLEYWYRTEEGCFRALLNLDGETGDVDGVLEEITETGGRIRQLSDGKVSTLKRAILDRFPSYELFINSSFAAQGRGDEFAKTKPSGRKDLFAQFLGLKALIEKAKTASEVAAAIEVVRDRVRAVLHALEPQVADAVAAGLASREQGLRVDAAEASQRRVALTSVIEQLDARLATMQDAVAAHGAASLRIQTLAAERDSRQVERQNLHSQRAAVTTTRLREIQAAATQQSTDLAEIDRLLSMIANDPKLAATLADLDKKIEGNTKIQALRADIVAAVAATTAADATLATARQDLEAVRQRQAETAIEIRQAEQHLAALAPIEQQHARAVLDTGLLADVPCGGAAPYDACQFLRNALAAKDQAADLLAQLRPKADLADRVGALARLALAHGDAVAAIQSTIAAADASKVIHAELAGLAEKLEASASRLQELQAMRDKATADAASAVEARRLDLHARRQRAVTTAIEATAAAQRRHDDAMATVTASLSVLDDRMAVLERDLAAAEEDRAAVSSANQEATGAQAELALARADWDAVIAAEARASHGLADIARAQQHLEEQRVRQVALTSKLATLDQALVDWRDLAKSLGKGGLADLEIDAAGPTITATANALLAHCAEARFALQIVTQVEKADGSGLKDDFTVQALDNADTRGWRDLRTFSGGQKTIIQEALMLAIALYVNERTPHKILTLWRDETGAALDPENALRYVEMLKRAREMGGLYAVYFVSHNADAAALADAQIVVADGTAAIQWPPYASASRAA